MLLAAGEQRVAAYARWQPQPTFYGLEKGKAVGIPRGEAYM